MFTHSHLLAFLIVVCLGSFVAAPIALVFSGGRAAGKTLLLALGVLMLIGRVGL